MTDVLDTANAGQVIGFIVDNTLGTKTVRIRIVEIMASTAATAGIFCRAYGDCTIGTLGNEQTVTAQGVFADASDLPDMKGCVFYESDDNAAGITGTSDGTILETMYTNLSGPNNMGPFIIKPGGNLCISYQVDSGEEWYCRVEGVVDL